MRRRTFRRDLVGTLVVFALLLVFCAVIILGENFLENFKSH